MRQDWQAFDEELARWADSGRTVRFWLRDDDAVEPTAALDRLLALGVPTLIAAIPVHTKPALAERLAGFAHAHVAVHGFAHINHAPSGQKKQELGIHRGAQIALDELAQGKARLASLFARKLLPVLVPPWNRIAPELVEELPGLGFRALSTFGGKRFKSNALLAVVDTHVDIIDWHGTRGGRPLDELIHELTQALAARRKDASTEPIGILSHHLVHDDAAWRALDWIIERTRGHWVGADALIAQA